jgi:hypothetical protein
MQSAASQRHFRRTFCRPSLWTRNKPRKKQSKCRRQVTTELFNLTPRLGHSTALLRTARDAHYNCIHTFTVLSRLTQHLKTNGIAYAHYDSHTDPAEYHEQREEPELVHFRNTGVTHGSVPEHLRTDIICWHWKLSQWTSSWK